MAKGATIVEVKKAKIELESSILKLLTDFEKEYDVRLGYINIERKHEDTSVPSRVDSPDPGPPVNITVSMDLDFE
jgi:hypothetical protein